MLDYRQYLPLAFLVLVVVMACATIRHNKVLLGVLGALLVYFSVSTYHINTHWETHESVWAQSIKFGGRAEAHVNYARVFQKINPELAELHLLEALRQQPRNFYANVNLGALRVNHGNFAEGLEILNRVVAWFPDWADAHFYLADAYKVMGNTPAQIEQLRLATELDPRALKYSYELALALQTNNKLKESMPYLERILSYNPTYELAGFMMGFAHQAMNDRQGAEAEYRRFLKYRPDYYQAWFNLAFIMMQRGDCRTAIEYFTRVITLNPQYTGAHSNLAKCYRALGNLALASKHEKLFQQGKTQ